MKVSSIDDARRAADALLAKGVGRGDHNLGDKGALLHTADRSDHVAAFDAGAVVETTGAGDAFNGGLAVGLSRGLEPLGAVRFACAVAGISVTRPGTAPSMPTLQDVETLLALMPRHSRLLKAARCSGQRIYLSLRLKFAMLVSSVWGKLPMSVLSLIRIALWASRFRYPEPR